MDLGSLLGKSPDEKRSYLAVKISSTAVLAATWELTDNQVAIGPLGAENITKDSWDELLRATDKAVSTTLGTETVTAVKTVFAVPYDWVEAGKISQEHLADLRRLCKELDLSPQGFVVITEALENYYKEVEGAPLTAILVGIDGANGFLTIYRAGRGLGTVKLESGEASDIAGAVEQVLKQNTQSEVLPSRIIIYDGQGDLAQIAENLTAFPWTKQLPFLHFPKVEVAPAELVVKAVAVAGGIQLGGKFEEAVEPAPPTELEEVSLEEAGFSTVENAVPETSSFGRIQEMPALEKMAPPPQVTKKMSLPKISLNFAFLGRIFEKIKPLVSKIKVPKNFTSKRSGILAVVGVAAVIAVLSLFFYFVPTATAIIKVSPKPFEKENDVVVVTDMTKVASTSSATLLGSFVDVSEVGTKKGVASGRKLVGDKARGSVTIYSVSSGKSFTAGTNLVAPAGLKLTLDHDVSIASGDAITPATITTTVTAADIGDTYNFPAGTKFTISGFSSSQYLAKNESALTGGNSHQATVVTKDDQDRLTATLSAELADRARSDLQNQLSPGQNLLPNAMTSSISKKKFSKDIDAEADTVSLDLTVDYRGVVFSISDLIAIFAQKYSVDITPGFSLAPGSAKVDVKSAKTDKAGNSILTIHLSGNLLPGIDKTDLVNHIAGKSISDAVAFIKVLPAVSEVSFEIKPRIFSPIGKLFLPAKKENIKIEIVSQ